MSSGIESDFESGPGNETRTVTVSAFTGPAGTGTLIDSGDDRGLRGQPDGRQLPGPARTRFRTSVAVPPASPPVNDGALEITQGGSVIATFTDFLTNDGAPDQLIASAPLAVSPPVVGAVTVVNTADPVISGRSGRCLARIQPGDEVHIRVDDQDLRIVPNGDTNDVTVTVLSVFRDPISGVDVIEDIEVVNLDTTVDLGRVHRSHPDEVRRHHRRVRAAVRAARQRDARGARPQPRARPVLRREPGGIRDSRVRRGQHPRPPRTTDRRRSSRSPAWFVICRTVDLIEQQGNNVFRLRRPPAGDEGVQLDPDRLAVGARRQPDVRGRDRRRPQPRPRRRGRARGALRDLLRATPRT